MKEVKEGAAMISLTIKDFNKLLLCARTCKDDYYIMQNLLQMEPLKESASQCIERMKYRNPIFKILDTFKEFKL